MDELEKQFDTARNLEAKAKELRLLGCDAVTSGAQGAIVTIADGCLCTSTSTRMALWEILEEALPAELYRVIVAEVNADGDRLCMRRLAGKTL